MNLPAAYIVPPGWPQVIEKLQQHGVEFTRLEKPTTFDVEQYRLDNPVWATAPFEGRLMLRVVRRKTETRHEMEFPGGLRASSSSISARRTWPCICSNRMRPDSLLRWGFLNAIFEEKEYGDARVLEKLAREMLARDPALKREFDDKLASDKAFADDADSAPAFFLQAFAVVCASRKWAFIPVAAPRAPTALGALIDNVKNMFGRIFDENILLRPLALAIGLALSSAALADTDPSLKASQFDKNVNPCQNLFDFVNDNFLKANPIPADRTTWGSSGMLDERSLNAQHAHRRESAEIEKCAGFDRTEDRRFLRLRHGRSGDRKSRARSDQG